MAPDRLRSPVRLIRRPLLFSHISAATLPPPPLHPSLQAPQISSARTPSTIHSPLTSGTAGLKLKGTSSMLSLSNSSIQVKIFVCALFALLEVGHQNKLSPSLSYFMKFTLSSLLFIGLKKITSSRSMKCQN